MKRIGNLYEKMLTKKHMDAVFAGVMKDKKRKRDPSSLSFMIMNNKEFYKADLCKMLEERSVKLSLPRIITRIDKGSGKERKIKAPSLWPDQFVHWSLMLAIQPTLMKGMDPYCCASIPLRGTEYAKKLIEKNLDTRIDNRRIGMAKIYRKHRYCLKMDIRKYFDNIDRDILMSMLRKRIKDEEILDLCDKVIRKVPGKGLPLGYYTSQWFANYYLQDFDHWIREKMLPNSSADLYIRFMDDMLVMGSNKRKLIILHNEIKNYLKSLKLELKDESDTIIDLHNENLEFIGYSFTYNKTGLRKNIADNILKANKRIYRGKYKSKHLKSFSSYKGFIDHTNTKKLFKSLLKGDRMLEMKMLKKLVKKQTYEDIVSGKMAIPYDIAEKIITLREETQNIGEDFVLIRYYPEKDEIKVVKRIKYRYRDVDYTELEAMKEIREENSYEIKKKKYKSNKSCEGRFVGGKIPNNRKRLNLPRERIDI